MALLVLPNSSPMNYPGMQLEILQIFAEAQSRRVDDNTADENLFWRKPRTDYNYIKKTNPKTGPKPVVDDMGQRYPSMREAARAHGVPKSGVHAVLAGKQKSTHGRMFKWAT